MVSVPARMASQSISLASRSPYSRSRLALPASSSRMRVAGIPAAMIAPVEVLTHQYEADRSSAHLYRSVLRDFATGDELIPEQPSKEPVAPFGFE